MYIYFTFIQAWINSWIELIEKLANYVEDYHKNGLKWYRWKGNSASKIVQLNIQSNIICDFKTSYVNKCDIKHATILSYIYADLFQPWNSFRNATNNNCFATTIHTHTLNWKLNNLNPIFLLRNLKWILSSHLIAAAYWNFSLNLLLSWQLTIKDGYKTFPPYCSYG